MIVCDEKNRAIAGNTLKSFSHSTREEKLAKRERKRDGDRQKRMKKVEGVKRPIHTYLYIVNPSNGTKLWFCPSTLVHSREHARDIAVSRLYEGHFFHYRAISKSAFFPDTSIVDFSHLPLVPSACSPNISELLENVLHIVRIFSWRANCEAFFTRNTTTRSLKEERKQFSPQPRVYFVISMSCVKKKKN